MCHLESGKLILLYDIDGVTNASEYSRLISLVKQFTKSKLRICAIRSSVIGGAGIFIAMHVVRL